MRVGAEGERAGLLRELGELHSELDSAMLRHRVASGVKVPMTPQQIKVIGLLVLGGPTRSGDLAEAIGVARPTMTGLLDRLEHAGFLTRSTDPRDGRGRLAEATVAGRKALRDLLNRMPTVHEGILAELSVEDLRAIAAGMQAILRVIRSQASGG